MDLDVNKIVEQLKKDDPEKFPAREEEEASEKASGSQIVYFCKDCKKTIDIKNTKSKKCPECKGKNIAYGTEKSIKNYYDFKQQMGGEE